MKKWSDDEINDFVQKALDRLNKNLKLGLTFEAAWLFSNSAGSVLHIQFRDRQGILYDTRNGAGMLQPDITIGADTIIGIPKQMPAENKIVLRIAWFIHLKYIREQEKRARANANNV